MAEGLELSVTVGDELRITAVDRMAVAWLNDHSAGFGVEFDKQHFVIEAERGGRTVGALVGSTNLSWLHVALLAVDPAARRGGVGSSLLARAEEIGRERGCVGAWLDTYDFQGPAYYPRFGYVAFGQIDDMPPGRVRYFFSKRL